MKKVLRLLEAAVVVAAILVLAVRGIEGDDFNEYRRKGGRNGFLEWFSKDVCGVTLPGLTDYDAEHEKRCAEKKRERERRRLAEMKEEAAAAEKKEAERQKLAERLEKARVAAGGTAASGGTTRGASGGTTARGGHGGSGGAIKVGGQSSFVKGDPKTPYRVAGIRGIEFGSTENAPGENVKPVLSVRELPDGSREFAGLSWRETKPLTEPVYGFDRAQLSHSYETEQLSSVTFIKSFPFTQEGMQQAVEFYRSMSAEASADLGFDVVDVDRTGSKGATIYEFRNGDGDTSIRGTISAWSEKNLTVTFSVTDKGYSAERRNQARAAYESGEADRVDARVEVLGRDYSAEMEKATDFLSR